MELRVSPYRLESKSRPRDGTLLQITTDEGYGYADIHPWPELGDLPLSEQLRLLAQGQLTPLTRRSLELARVDAKFRANKQNAFGSLTIPESHYLVPNLQLLGDLAPVWDWGFRTLKIKLGSHLTEETDRLNADRASLSMFRLRFDFNGRLASEDFSRFAESLAPELRAQVDFVEDPVPWNAEVWRDIAGLGLPLALDRVSETQAADLDEALTMVNAPPFSWCVLKPAVQEPTRLAEIAKRARAGLIVTSYLDHPLGQVAAAFEASRLAAEETRIGTCGLLTHLVYDTNRYSSELRVEGARLVPPLGTGFGFDALLAKEPWKIMSCF